MKISGKIQAVIVSAVVVWALCGCNQQSDTTPAASTNSSTSVNSAPATVTDTSVTNSASTNQPPPVTPMPDASQATTNAPAPGTDAARAADQPQPQRCHCGFNG